MMGIEAAIPNSGEMNLLDLTVSPRTAHRTRPWWILFTVLIPSRVRRVRGNDLSNDEQDFC
jgi:hypothetical protein